MQKTFPSIYQAIVPSHGRLLFPILIFLSAFFYLPAPQLCAAADVSVSAAVDPAEIRPGGYTNFILTIEGGQPDRSPQLQLPSDVELAGGPSISTQINITGGVMRRTVSLTWQISSSKAGDYVIPAQEIQAGGKAYRSNEVRISFNDNPANPAAQFDPLLTIETPKREIYLGEVIPITVNLYAHRLTTPRRVGLIEIPKDNFAIQRFSTQTEETIMPIGGVPYRAFAFHSTLSALKAGRFKLGPATTEVIIDVPLESGRQFNSIFSPSESRRVRPQGNEIEMTVLPLPVVGKPSNFSGVVGDFKMKSVAEPREGSVGDPISVEVEVTGSGNFDAIPAPALTTSEEWKAYPAKRINIERADATSGNVQSHATFSQVVIPKKVLTAIPSFEFSYFNPETKTYSTARTEPIPLRLKPGATPPATSSSTGITKGSGDQIPSDAETVPPVQPHITDIITVLPAKSTWIALRPPLLNDRTFIIWNAGALGALILLIGGKMFASFLRSRAAAPDATCRRMWSTLRRARMSRGEFYQSVARYLQQRSQHGAQIPSQWQIILDRNDAINYRRTSDEADQPMPSAERREVLNSIQV